MSDDNSEKESMTHPNIPDGSDDDIEQLFRAFVFEACTDILAHSQPGVPRDVDESFLNTNLKIGTAEMRNIIRKAKCDPAVMQMLQNGYRNELERRIQSSTMEKERMQDAPTLSTREQEIISVTMHVEEIAEELKRAWEFLSEEKDRWGKSYDIRGPLRSMLNNTPPKTRRGRLSKQQRADVEESKNIAQQILTFAAVDQKAVALGLDDHPHIQELLGEARKDCQNILNGSFLSYPDADTLAGAESAMNDIYPTLNIMSEIIHELKGGKGPANDMFSTVNSRKGNMGKWKRRKQKRQRNEGSIDDRTIL